MKIKKYRSKGFGEAAPERQLAIDACASNEQELHALLRVMRRLQVQYGYEVEMHVVIDAKK